jgi:putative N6-adenine-specific DNA methylase
MKAAIITIPGLEFSAELEVKEILKKESVTEKSVVVFDFDDYEDIVRLSYISQSASKIIILLNKINFKSVDDFNKIKLDLSEFIEKNQTFAIRCNKEGDYDFKSEEISSIIGKNISYKVDLESPDVVVFVHLVDDVAYIGIDVTQMDLSKRQYKIFNSPTSLKGTTAYALSRFAGVSKDIVILDPHCKDGTVIIETALFLSGFPVRYYDKEKFVFDRMNPFKKLNIDKIFEREDKKVKEIENLHASDELQKEVVACQKNSKVAGVNKFIHFTRVEFDWLDIKFKQAMIDLFVSNFVWPTRKVSEKDIRKKVKEFFYQANYLLSKTGKVCLITRNPIYFVEESKKEKFKLSEELEIKIGDEKLVLMSFSRE